MAVRRYGDGDKVIVFLHGLGEAGGIFDDLLATAELQRPAYTNVVPDLPGYGRSAWPAVPASLGELADQLAAWLSGFSRPPLVVGHSMGGVLSVLLAERTPAVVRAIVNIEGNVSLGDSTFSGRVAAWSPDDYVVHGHDKLVDEIFAIGLAGGPARYYHAAFRFADPASTHKHARDLVDISTTESMAGRMATVPVPVRFVAGVPNGLAERSLELLDVAGIPTLRVEPAGHWVYVDQPDPCAEVIAALA